MKTTGYIWRFSILNDCFSIEHIPSKVEKSCRNVHISYKMCKFLSPVTLQDQNLASFLHQWPCKMKLLVLLPPVLLQDEILQVSCTRTLVRWKSCNFPAPLPLQDEKSCKFLALVTLWNGNLASFLHHLPSRIKILQVFYTSKLWSWNSCKILYYLSCRPFTPINLVSCTTCISDEDNLLQGFKNFSCSWLLV